MLGMPFLARELEPDVSGECGSESFLCPADAVLLRGVHGEGMRTRGRGFFEELGGPMARENQREKGN